MSTFDAKHNPEGWDPLLAQFVRARTDAEEDEALERLLREMDPLIRMMVRQRAGLFAGSPRGTISQEGERLEDLRSTAILYLLEALHRAKSGEGGAEPIRSIKALAETIVRHGVFAYLRERYPQRASLQNQVRYVLRKYTDPRTGQTRFDLWVVDLERLCGFGEWRGRPLKVTSNYEQLRKAPMSVVTRLLPDVNLTTLKLLHLLLTLFDWLRVPMRLEDLIGVVAQVQGVDDAPELSLDASQQEGEGIPEPAARELTPEKQTLLREDLECVWRSLGGLPPQQCAALLLNLTDHRGKGVIDLLPALGIAGVRQIAAVMQMPAETLAQLWPRLPLDDEAIGRQLGCPTGRVAVWRCRARKKLLSGVAAEAAKRGGNNG